MSTLVLLVVVTFLLFVLDAAVKRARRSSNAWPVESRFPLTQIEQKLFFHLSAAVPEYLILSQVALSRLVEVKRVPGSQTVRNKVSQKSVDFVVCDRSFRVLAVIELDDLTHDRLSRKRTDSDKDAALAAAGIRVIRWRVNSVPDRLAIRSEFNLQPGQETAFIAVTDRMLL